MVAAVTRRPGQATVTAVVRCRHAMKEFAHRFALPSHSPLRSVGLSAGIAVAVVMLASGCDSNASHQAADTTLGVPTSDVAHNRDTVSGVVTPLIGQPLSEFVTAAGRANIAVRVTEQDGVSKSAPFDYKALRVNVVVQRGTVVGVQYIG